MKTLIEPPFNYTGSKFKSLNQIIPLLDTSCHRFVDLFGGGGSVWSNVVDLYPHVVANDIIYHLVEVQKRLVTDPIGTIAKTRALCVAKDDQVGFHVLRDAFNAGPTPEGLWALMLCSTNNMMRFNRSWKYNQTFGKRTFNDRTQAKAEAFAAHLAPFLPNITFKSLDFEKVGVLPTDQVLIDPPYSNTEAGYNAYWRKDDDVRLFNWITRMVGKGTKIAVCGSYSHNGVPCRLLDLLKAAGFAMVEIAASYNKVSRVGDKVTQEVMMLSYDPVTKHSLTASTFAVPETSAVLV